MNKVYKPVWSRVRKGYVVTSELAKRRSKGSGRRVIISGGGSGIITYECFLRTYGICCGSRSLA